MNITIKNKDGITLQTANSYCAEDIVVSLDDTLIPSGTLPINENGTYDVEQYASVEVNVESSVVEPDYSTEDGIIKRTLTEYINPRVNSIGEYTFYNSTTLTKVVFQNVSTIDNYAFANYTNLNFVDILGGGILYGSPSNSCFVNCTNIKTVIIRNPNKVTTLQGTIFPYFAGVANITRTFKRSQWTTYGATGHTENWSGLTVRAKGTITYFKGTISDEDSKPVWLFGEYTANSTNLKTIAFVETQEEADALIEQYENEFKENGCMFYFYNSIVSDYKSATNWSVYADNFRTIEDYPEICGG